MKALVIMIVRRLHRVGELLAVLEESTPEMRMVRQLLAEEGRFPARRTFQRRLKLDSLLKKSLLNRSVVQNRIQTLRYQGQNTAMAGFLSP